MRLHRPAVGQAGDLGKELLVAALVSLAGCTTRSTLSEGTVTVIGPNGGIVTSADTFLELRFPPGVLSADTSISIITDRTTSVQSVVSPLYRVEPAGLALMRPVIASYHAGDANGVIWVGRRALGTADDGVFTELPSSEVTQDYDRQNHVARGEVSGFARNAFALAEINEVGRCLAEACGTPCGGCSAADRGCMPSGDGNVCDGSGGCAPPDPVCPTQGWDEPPSSGTAFVFSDLALASSGIGAHLAEDGNSLIRSGIVGGELLLLAELAGLDYVITYGEDPHVTLKLYEAADADEVFFPANNFAGTDCCQFLIQRRSLDLDQAAVRLPARIAGGVLENVGTREGPRLAFPFFVTRTSSTPLEDTHFDLVFSSNGDALEGTLGGVVTIDSLYRTPNPYCISMSSALCPSGIPTSTLLDLFAGFMDADVDRDGDGIERVILDPTGRAIRCLDGDGSIVPPLVFDAPETCPGRPEMADGYALSYAVKLVRARIVGFRD